MCKLRPDWAGKYKFGARASKYKFRARAGVRGRGPGPGLGAKQRAGGREIQIPFSIIMMLVKYVEERLQKRSSLKHVSISKWLKEGVH